MRTSMFPPTSVDKVQLTTTRYNKEITKTLTHTCDAMFVYFTWTRHWPIVCCEEVNKSRFLRARKFTAKKLP